MKHKIVIELDVPEGLEAAVTDAAYATHEALGVQWRKQVGELDGAALDIHNATLKERPKEVQEVMNTLRARARRKNDAFNIISLALSQLTHEMGEADRQWRMKQSQEQEPTND